MTIDPISEDLIPLGEIGKCLGIRKHCSTFHRWRHPGVQGQRLETIRIGGVYYTSRAALMHFFRALSEARESSKGRQALDSEREDQILRQLENRFKL